VTTRHDNDTYTILSTHSVQRKMMKKEPETLQCGAAVQSPCPAFGLLRPAPFLGERDRQSARGWGKMGRIERIRKRDMYMYVCDEEERYRYMYVCVPR